MKRILLCSDLDRTLIPNGAQPESAESRVRFKRLASREEVTLAYVSGRSRQLVEQAIAEFGLPQPDFVIADVGASIYQATSSGWSRWDEWDARIAPDWNGATHGELIQLLSVFPALRLQQQERQGRHKLSFHVAVEIDAHRLIAEIDRRLKYADIRAKLIWSIDEIAQTGLLDVLPASAGKLHAIRFLMMNRDFAPESTVFAGDSGNDLDVLVSDIPSVLVANADPELKSRIAETGKASCYLARGGYLGLNGNYSAGVLEGVAHHFPEVDAWLRVANGQPHRGGD
jgi:sucrose-6-phosphatase